jgi:hypothetical protein
MLVVVAVLMVVLVVLAVVQLAELQVVAQQRQQPILVLAVAETTIVLELAVAV